MNYNSIPRPEIEHHYHIQELIERQEKRSDDRNYHREKAKEKLEREDLIKDAKIREVKEFWCESCKEDFLAESIREVESDWTANQQIAFYRTKHFCGKWCVRLITDRHRDAYWFKSKKVARDKAEHFADTIQPYQTGFNTLYKKI